MKFDTMNLKANIDKRQIDNTINLRKEPDSPTREIGSPTRREIMSPSKKDIISPVKIIVTNVDPRRLDGTPLNQNSINSTNQFFDVTFYNTKSSVLPPIMPLK
jgi:hypothetical protein